MAITINPAAVEHTKRLIDEGLVTVDSDWDEAQPSNSEENTYLEEHGWNVFGRWNLAIDTNENRFSKSHYMFLLGDFETIHRSSLVAARDHADEVGYENVKEAAEELLAHLDSADS